MEKKVNGTGIILSALFAAITAAGCFIQIPLPGGIPIVLQDMMAMLSGLLLGPVYGGIAVLVFLVLGSIGLPVFSGKAGIQVILAGPTGGFLIGYFAGAVIGGLFLHILLHPSKDHSKTKQILLITAAAIIATVVVFVLGILGFMRVTGKAIGPTCAAVVLPFIPGNTIKIVLMVLLTLKFRPTIYRYLHK